MQVTEETVKADILVRSTVLTYRTFCSECTAKVLDNNFNLVGGQLFLEMPSLFLLARVQNLPQGGKYFKKVTENLGVNSGSNIVKFGTRVPVFSGGEVMGMNANDIYFGSQSGKILIGTGGTARYYTTIMQVYPTNLGPETCLW